MDTCTLCTNFDTHVQPTSTHMSSLHAQVTTHVLSASARPSHHIHVHIHSINPYTQIQIRVYSKSKYIHIHIHTQTQTHLERHISSIFLLHFCCGLTQNNNYSNYHSKYYSNYNSNTNLLLNLCCGLTQTLQLQCPTPNTTQITTEKKFPTYYCTHPLAVVVN